MSSNPLDDKNFIVSIFKYLFDGKEIPLNGLRYRIEELKLQVNQKEDFSDDVPAVQQWVDTDISVTEFIQLIARTELIDRVEMLGRLDLSDNIAKRTR